MQFELENSVKRFQRLDGEDHFNSPEKPKVNLDAYSQTGNMNVASALRSDDIDVYLRCITYEDKIMLPADKFVRRVRWVPMTHRFEVYQDSIECFQSMRNAAIGKQKEHI